MLKKLVFQQLLKFQNRTGQASGETVIQLKNLFFLFQSWPPSFPHSTKSPNLSTSTLAGSGSCWLFVPFRSHRVWSSLEAKNIKKKPKGREGFNIFFPPASVMRERGNASNFTSKIHVFEVFKESPAQKGWWNLERVFTNMLIQL